ncbi:MAG: stage II sporulation protein R [Oscillibacter sp.]|nr:stage II sporulation protein R [Oscillibacter sp.]
MKQGNTRRGDISWGLAWLALGLFLLTGVWAVGEQERLAGQVVRLHVLAASDSRLDQARKLRVRDAVLSYTEDCLRDAGSRDEAAALLRRRLPEIEQAAASVLAAEGCADAVRAELAETDFPTRVYEGGTDSGGAYPDGGDGGFSLPAGRYLALRIVIGPGTGRNWWCVVFPPLCGGGTEKTVQAEKAQETRKTGQAEKAQETGKTGQTGSAQEARKTGQAGNAQETGKMEQTGKAQEAGKTGQAGSARETGKTGQTGNVQQARKGQPAEKSAIPEDTDPAEAGPETGVSKAETRQTAEERAAAPAAFAVRGLPTAAQRYEVRFRVVELWGHIRMALS